MLVTHLLTYLLTTLTSPRGAFAPKNADEWLQKRAQEVLEWAVKQLKNKTFPRDDFKEVVHLLVVWLRGHVEDFTFKFPGADHHARWMSKLIYALKITLLSNTIEVCENSEVDPDESSDKDDKKRKRAKAKKLRGIVITEDEKQEMAEISEFIGVFYAKALLESPLSSSAPHNDLVFMANMSQYRQHNEKIS